MKYERFFIAPFDSSSGIVTDLKPWLIPDNAFLNLQDAYVFRGRVRKRFGNQWLGNSSFATRLRISIGTTDGSGNFSGYVPRTISNTVITTPAIGQQFSISTTTFTVTFVNSGVDNLLRSDNSASTATFNTALSSGQVIINGSVINSTVYYYPCLPVMGLCDYDVPGGGISTEVTFAFDENYAYCRTNGGWDRLAGAGSTGADWWLGSDINFFWSVNWVNVTAADTVLFVSNNNTTEYVATTHPVSTLRYWSQALMQWNVFRPQLDNVPNFLNNALMLVVFKNRLVALNTWEGQETNASTFTNYPGTNYQARARWSNALSPLSANSWNVNIPNNGGGKDAPTTEKIISCEFVKDRLIVYFERSTYELVYNNNYVDPFSWQKINTELGVESTFSTIPFDRVCIGVGNVGIHACNGANVERIDNTIPEVVFNIHDESNGVQRIFGIRDYDIEMIYWTFPDTNGTSTAFPYPNRILVYNYKTGTWAFFNESITCFGYFQAQLNNGEAIGASWDSESILWDDDVTWGAGSNQPLFRRVIAGNNQGWTFFCNPEFTHNEATLSITNVVISSGSYVATVTSVNHNLRQGDYVYIDSVSPQTGSNYDLLLNEEIFEVSPSGTATPTSNTFTILLDYSSPVPTGSYGGGGQITRVADINILTKQYNFYAEAARNAAFMKAEFMVDRTDYGQITVDYLISSAGNSMVAAQGLSGSGVGTNVLSSAPYPSINFEQYQERLWHPVYFQGNGEVIQLNFYMSPAQLLDNNVRISDFQLHAMVFFVTPTSRLQ